MEPSPVESRVECASRVLNGRAEQIRAGTWDQITTADFLRTTVLAATPDAAGELAALNETIKIIAYPTPSPNPAPIPVTRNNTTGVATTVGGDGTMPALTSIRIRRGGTEFAVTAGHYASLQ